MPPALTQLPTPSESSREITVVEKTDPARAAQQARKWALIIPREHGAWGLLLVPLFTGVVAGAASAHHIWSLLTFVVAALSLFWLRTPVESLIGAGSMKARTSRERWTASIASILLAMVSALCLTGLMWRGRNLELLVLGTATGIAFAVQTVLLKLGRSTRTLAQLVGAIGLTCTAPAAYYIGTGRLDGRALLLWAANWIFAGNQIHFVQMRIHAGRAATFSDKLARGRLFFLAQPLLLAALVLASIWKAIPALMIVAFVPALVRGTQWFFGKPEPLNVRSLGWSEMKQGVVFGILLAISFFWF